MWQELRSKEEQKVRDIPIYGGKIPTGAESRKGELHECNGPARGDSVPGLRGGAVAILDACAEEKTQGSLLPTDPQTPTSVEMGMTQ